MTVSVDTDDVGVMAGKLSPKMRTMLRSAAPYHDGEPLRCWGNESTKAALRSRGLARGELCYLTPLGLAVRDYILEQSA